MLEIHFFHVFSYCLLRLFGSFTVCFWSDIINMEGGKLELGGLQEIRICTLAHLVSN